VNSDFLGTLWQCQSCTWPLELGCCRWHFSSLMIC